MSFLCLQVSHPNIVSLIEEFHTPTQLYLVMELVKVITWWWLLIGAEP